MKISQLVLWTDVGFQDGSVEVPSVSNCQTEHLGERLSDLPDALAIYTDITPTKGRWFSEFKLKGKYSDLKKASYLRMTYDDAFYFGWIDSVELLNDTYVQVQGGDDLDFNEVRVSWHIDHWRTYLTAATFGYGIVERRPRQEQDPIQNLSYRYRLAGDYRSLVPQVPGSDVNWLIFTYVKEETGNSTKIRTCVVPIDKNNLDANYFVEIGNTSVKTPSLAQVVSGEFLTKMRISAQQVTSAFLSPVPPFAIDRKDGTTYYPATSSTTTTEFVPSDVDDSEYKRVISSSCRIIRSQAFTSYNVTVNFSDGTSASYGYTDTPEGRQEFLDWVHGFNGFTGGDKVSATTYYKYRLRDLMSVIFPNTAFQNGERIVIRNVTTSFSDSVSFGSGGVTYTAELGTLSEREFTYSDGWTDIVLYSPSRLDATFYGMRQSTQFSIGVEYPSTEQDALGYAYTNSQNMYEYSLDLGDIRTTDQSELTVIDMNGVPTASVPWGLSLGSGTVRVIVSSVSAYMEYRFASKEYSNADGLSFSIPLPPVDIASNSWVDYVYSGQREYDIQQRRIARDQALVSAVGGSITNAASGAMMGGLRESATFRSESIPTARSIGNMAGFGALGGVSGLMGAGLDYAAAGYFNDQLQGAQDQLSAKRLDSIMVSGQGWDWLWHGCAPGIITMVPDDYSLDRFRESVELSGIVVSEPTRDCTEYIENGGPLKISQLVVGGPIPVEARAYIKNRLNDGVILKE